MGSSTGLLTGGGTGARFTAAALDAASAGPGREGFSAGDSPGVFLRSGCFLLAASFPPALKLTVSTLSLRISAKPNSVSTRNMSFSKPTIVPTTFWPSLRTSSSAAAGTSPNDAAIMTASGTRSFGRCWMVSTVTLSIFSGRRSRVLGFSRSERRGRARPSARWPVAAALCRSPRGRSASAWRPCRQ